MENKIKLTYIASYINFSNGLEWMVEHMDDNKYDIEFVFLNPEIPEIYKRLKAKGIKVIYYKYRGKRDILKVMAQLFMYFVKNKPQVIHTHLFDASLAALPMAKIAGVKKRIHTRHHATLHHDSHPHAIKYDRVINYLSNTIVAVSENVKNILVEMEKVDSRKVVVVHHGFDFSFTNVKAESIDSMREKYDLKNYYPVVGVVSRFVDWKGIQYIIPAFRKLLNDYPKAKLVLANAKGDYNSEITKLLSTLTPLSYITIEFEEEIFSLIKSFDFIVHAPVSKQAEAFGQIYIEAMSCKIPLICTLSGVAVEYIEDHKNALVVEYCNSENIYISMIELIKNPEFKSALINHAYNDVISQFTIDRMIASLKIIYE